MAANNVTKKVGATRDAGILMKHITLGEMVLISAENVGSLKITLSEIGSGVEMESIKMV